MAEARFRVITGQLASAEVAADPLRFQAECVEAFVASWTARGFAATTIGNDAGLLERMLAALGRPAWEATAEDVDRVVGELAAAGRAVSTRRNYLQVFKGFHRFLEARKAAEIEAAFGVRLACPVDEFNGSRGDPADARALGDGVHDAVRPPLGDVHRGRLPAGGLGRPRRAHRRGMSMRITWKLRMAAAQREVWTGAQLRRLLAERAGLQLSSASVSALFTRQPSQIKLTTLAALCTTLQCTPGDLFDIDTTPVERPAGPAPAARPVVADRPRAGRGRSMPPI